MVTIIGVAMSTQDQNWDLKIVALVAPVDKRPWQVQPLHCVVCSLGPNPLRGLGGCKL